MDIDINGARTLTAQTLGRQGKACAMKFSTPKAPLHLNTTYKSNTLCGLTYETPAPQGFVLLHNREECR